MKNQQLSLIFVSLFFLFSANAKITKDCSFVGSADKTKKLFGNVHVVGSGADYKVRIVDFNPDLKVQVLNYKSNQCGQWSFINSSGDINVQFVDSGEDFTIQFVNSNPGLN